MVTIFHRASRSALNGFRNIANASWIYTTPCASTNALPLSIVWMHYASAAGILSFLRFYGCRQGQDVLFQRYRICLRTHTRPHTRTPYSHRHIHIHTYPLLLSRCRRQWDTITSITGANFRHNRETASRIPPPHITNVLDCKLRRRVSRRCTARTYSPATSQDRNYVFSAAWLSSSVYTLLSMCISIRTVSINTN